MGRMNGKRSAIIFHYDFSKTGRLETSNVVN